MSEDKTHDPAWLKKVWLALMGLTLISALVAEQADPSLQIVLAICAAVAIKGGLVVEWLMGLRSANKQIRWVMLSYFIILPPLIALGFIFPDVVLRLTSL